MGNNHSQGQRDSSPSRRRTNLHHQHIETDDSPQAAGSSSINESTAGEHPLNSTSVHPSRRKRYPESTSTSSSSRSGMEMTDQEQPVPEKPTMGRRISSIIGRRNRAGGFFGSRTPSSASLQSQQQQQSHEDKRKGKENIRQDTQNEDEAKGAERRTKIGQGEPKRRKIDGTFSHTSSRTQSEIFNSADRQQGIANKHEQSEDIEMVFPEADEQSILIKREQSDRATEHSDLDGTTDEDELCTGVEGNEKASVVNTPTEIPTGVPGSPPIVPLAEGDPLLTDRLRTLSTIWEVLGSDVARSLPSVATADAVRRASLTGSTVPREVFAQADPNGIIQAQTVDEPDLSRLPPLPPSTVSLLEDLEEDARLRSLAQSGLSLEDLMGDVQVETPNQPSQVDPPSIVISEQEVRQEASVDPRGFGDALSTLPPLMQRPSMTSIVSAASDSSARGNRRRSRIGGLADRVSNWFGLNGDRTANSNSAHGRDESNHNNVSPEAATETDGIESSTSDSTTREPQAPPRLPQGAVMMIQGFVQTAHEPESLRPANEDMTGTASSASSAMPSVDITSSARPRASSISSSSPYTLEVEPATSLRPASTRRLSDSDYLSRNTRNGSGIRAGSTERNARGARRIFSRSRSHGQEAAHRPSLEDQARMLAGLMSVATAATATSLLSIRSGAEDAPPTERPASPPSGPRAALNALRDRLRMSNDSGSASDSGGLENILRNYMQHAMRPDRDVDSSANDPADPQSDQNGQTSDSADSAVRPLNTILPTADSASFAGFLNDMQRGLIRAIREFHGDSISVSEATDQDPSSTGQADTIASNSATASDPASALVDEPEEAEQDPASPMDLDPTDVENSSISATAVPDASGTAHSPSQTNSNGSRRLNFFRMYQFPARPQPPPVHTPAPGAPLPPSSLIPVVIVGVRSLNRDINSIGDQGEAVPFPFSDAAEVNDHGRGPEPTPAESSETTDAQTTSATEPDIATGATANATTEPEISPERRNRIIRALAALVQGDRETAHREAEALARIARAVTNNYVIWVVGGYYPAGHPILTIPHLFTGELSHDDLWALAEAMGQAKPPTATKEDIAKAGLKVVKGKDVPAAVETGLVHDMCLDRCLVCLSDYESEEDCRVMSCRHAYHVECIDRWLETGRNSCPACRQAGVKTSRDQAEELENIERPVPSDQSIAAGSGHGNEAEISDPADHLTVL